MKPRTVLLPAALCGVLLVLCGRSSEPEERSAPAQDEHASAPAARVASSQPQASAAPPRARAPAETPRLPREHVAFDRRPWNPEFREAYEDRTRIVDAWDRFRAESGISDQRAQALLTLLFDYHENSKYLTADLYKGGPYHREPWVFERRLAAVSAMDHTLYIQTCEAVKKMLSREEYRVWRRTVEQANIWGALGVGDLFTQGRSLEDLMLSD